MRGEAWGAGDGREPTIQVLSREFTAPVPRDAGRTRHRLLHARALAGARTQNRPDQARPGTGVTAGPGTGF